MTPRPAVVAALAALLLTASLGVGSVRSAAASTADGSPIGHLDAVTVTPASARVVGWAADPDTISHTVAVSIWVDGVLVAYDPDAIDSRPDVGNALPGYGPNHGFAETISWSGGAHQVCAAALNAPGSAGVDASIGCIMTTGAPFGSFETFFLGGSGPNSAPVGPGGATNVVGWAIDPDTTGPVPIAVFLDGTLIAYTPAADMVRNDVAAAYPIYGAAHGFNMPITVPPGEQHLLCVAAINAPGTGGSDTMLSCIWADSTPKFVGTVDSIEQTDLGLRVVGWIADAFGSTDALPLAVFLDGQLVSYTPAAGLYRPDIVCPRGCVGGPYHGFDQSFMASPGYHEMCLTSAGPNGVEGVFECIGVYKASLR
jgi:hypothetical protein